MGVNRDLKKATEAYWAEKLSQDELLAEGKRLRQEHWKIQKDAGIDIIPSNDFSYYDHVLDHIQFFGVWHIHLAGITNSENYRLFQRDIQNTILHQSTSSSLWEEAFRSLPRVENLPLTYRVW